MTITPGYELATDAQFRVLSNLSTPPRAGRVTAIETSGQVRVETDDPDGGDVLAWPLDGFLYAVNDVVYITFSLNSPDSAIVVGSLGNLPTINPLMVPFVRVDGSTPLTGDWIAGALRSIEIGKLLGSAAASGSLTIYSTADATKGKVIFGLAGANAYDEVNERFGFGTASPTVDLHLKKTVNGIVRMRSENASNGAAALAIVEAWNDLSHTIQFIATSSGFTPSGLATADQGIMNANGFPMLFRTIGAFPISFGVNTTVEGMRILSSGVITTGGLTSAGASQLGVRAGGATVANDAAVGGVLTEITTQTGNVGVGEDDLSSYSVPANTLSANGMSLWFEAFGSFANTLNAKRIRVQFGAAGTTLVFDLGSGNNFSNQYWHLRGRIVRTGAATQKGSAMLVTGVNGGGPGSAAAFVATGLSQTLSGAVTLKVTGEATANNDVVIESFTVGWDDANT